MACEYGEAFKQPRDFMTGKVIKDAPHMGSPANNKPYGSTGNGHIILRPAVDVMENTTLNGRPMIPEVIDQARVTDIDHYPGY